MMIGNFNAMLIAIRNARTQTQLEQAVRTAFNVIDVWLNADAITLADYKRMKKQIVDAQTRQLIDPHPCAGKCENYLNEQCCHCLVRGSA